MNFPERWKLHLFSAYILDSLFLGKEQFVFIVRFFFRGTVINLSGDVMFLTT